MGASVFRMRLIIILGSLGHWTVKLTTTDDTIFTQ